MTTENDHQSQYDEEALYEAIYADSTQDGWAQATSDGRVTLSKEGSSPVFLSCRRPSRWYSYGTVIARFFDVRERKEVRIRVPLYCSGKQLTAFLKRLGKLRKAATLSGEARAVAVERAARKEAYALAFTERAMPNHEADVAEAISGYGVARGEVYTEMNRINEQHRPGFLSALDVHLPCGLYQEMTWLDGDNPFAFTIRHQGRLSAESLTGVVDIFGDTQMLLVPMMEALKETWEAGIELVDKQEELMEKGKRLFEQEEGATPTTTHTSPT